MTTTDYNQKKRECREEFTTISPQYKAFSFAFDRAFALGKQEKNAEGEEMLTVSRTKIEALHSEIHKAIMDAHDADDWQDAAHYILDILPRSFNALFVSKCLPDEKVSDCHHLQEPKPAEPKYHVGQRMYIKFLNKIGTIDIVQGYNDGEDGIYYHLKVEPKGVASAREDFLEPYTEPKEDHIVVNNEMVKDFDTILKDSFSKERRLNIAAMAMQGILSNADRMKQYGEIAAREPESLTEIVVRNALR